MANCLRNSTHVLSQSEIEAAFKVQISELNTIDEPVTYLNSQQHEEALEDNLSAIKSDLDPEYGMLYIIKDTLVLPNGPAAQINLIVHPDDEPEWAVGITMRQYSNEYNVWDWEKLTGQIDKNVSSSTKDFILGSLSEDPFLRLKNRRTKYNNRTAREMYVIVWQILELQIVFMFNYSNRLTTIRKWCVT